ncbi:MAG TPA: exopolysaccharide biosynthesis polyprenyl glycosylphosphotransferase, partial [Nitriliruptorales bacterium]|nr:exopolysaccharide biosynthesis polyprenyl glycosylphosphotransferase [Nitriliruptorales bacterium]
LRLGARTGVRAAVAFGAAGDFVAGTSERAPAALRRAGLEWLYRLLKEPDRLARRYLVQAPSSVYRLLTQSRTDELVEAGRRSRPAPLLSTPAEWRRRLGRLLVVADAAAIALASFLAYVLRATLGELGVIRGFENEIPVALGVLPLWLAILYGFGCYRPQYLNAGGEALRRFVAGAFGGLLALGFVSFALNLQLARGYVALLFVSVVAFGLATRLVVREYLRRQRRRGRFTQNVLVAGADEEAIQVARAMSAADAAGYRVVGFLDDDVPVGDVVVGDVRVVGRVDDALDRAYQLRAGLVVVSPTGVRPGTLRDVTVALEGSRVDLAVAPSLFAVVTHRVTVESVANAPLLHVDQIRLERGRSVVKRTLDMVGAAVLLAVLWPVMLAAALAVRTADGGPVLFRQVRVGRDGATFTLLKFRTMVVDAEDRLEEVQRFNESGHHFFKVRDDPRVTRVGRVLRKWSIDETPQLLNVLRGDMALVGPRPPLPREVEKYEPWHRRRLRVRPGITGMWQVSGRANVPFDEAVRMDLFYIENWSLGLDLFVLAKTMLAVLGRTGAY